MQRGNAKEHEEITDRRLDSIAKSSQSEVSLLVHWYGTCGLQTVRKYISSGEGNHIGK